MGRSGLRVTGVPPGLPFPDPPAEGAPGWGGVHIWMVLLGSGRHAVGLCGSDLYLTPPMSHTGKNPTDRATDERGSGWVGVVEAGHLLGDL